MYGENGFYMASGSFGDFYGSGMEYSTMTYEGTDVTFGGSYTMGDFMIGATMHTITSEDETVDYSVMDLSLGRIENLLKKSIIKILFLAFSVFSSNSNLLLLFASQLE